MKVDELFSKYFTMLSDQPVLTRDSFKDALDEDRNQIVAKIDEMIEQVDTSLEEYLWEEDIVDWREKVLKIIRDAVIEDLTELKNFMEEL